jgi:hypothetical protein
MIPQATETFKEDVFPSVGIVIKKSAFFCKDKLIPFSSFPTIKQVFLS